MIDDKMMLFEEQAITNASMLSTVIDFGDAEQPGQGSPLYLNIYCDTAFTGATTGSGSGIQFDLCTSDASGCSNDVLMTVVPYIATFSAGPFGSTGLKYRQALPAEKLDRFVALAANLSGAVASGKITAYLDTK